MDQPEHREQEHLSNDPDDRRRIEKLLDEALASPLEPLDMDAIREEVHHRLAENE